jgi:hypothetical protein
MSTILVFTFTPTEYSELLTNQTHNTLNWLLAHKYITDEEREQLISTLVVTPIQNKSKWGARILARFFDKESADDLWVFPITQLDNFVPQKPTKPKLEIV